MMEKRKGGRKRGGSGSASKTNHVDDQPTKRQRKAAMATAPYFTLKPSSSIRCINAEVDQLMPQQRIDLIANLSESILEDPSIALTSSRTEVSSSGGASKGTEEKDDDESNLKKDPQYHKIQSKMNKLLDLASLSHNGHDSHAARLALLSLLAIFQDILPSYRIRLPTEAETSVRVSKEIKATWDYERKLLQAYQRYLQLLERTWEDGKFGLKWSAGKKGNAPQGGGPPTTLAATAILSLSALLQTSYNFNFRTNILQVVVRQANHRSSEEVRSSCCSALSVMFAKDMQGDASLEAVRLMAKMIKQQFTNHRGAKAIHPGVLNTWLSLPLRVHEDEAMAAQLAAAAKAKKAKKSQQDKDTADIEKDMKEGEATVDKMELAKNQADCLHAVTLTYFRILKLVVQLYETESNGPSTSNHSSAALDLLPCALRGLTTFSQLIHLDAVVDLLSVLKDLLKHVSSLPPDAAIHCILCALKTLLRGPGRETLPVDPKDYLIPLYNILPRLGVAKIESGTDKESGGGLLSSSAGSDRTIQVAIQCLDHAFLQRRELSMARLAAFLKCLASTSLHCPPYLGCPLLACARQISARYSSSKVERMLENEEDIVAEGMFAPEAEDPEHSNAHASSLWELSLLRYSVHPVMAEHALAMSEGRLLKLPAEAPVKILVSMGRDVQEAFIPQRAVWKKHPLENKVQLDDGTLDVSSRRKKRQRRSQNQIRFITPRKSAVSAASVSALARS